MARVIDQEYLREFHRRRPGITEAVLNRARSNGVSAYQWLAEAVPQQGLVLDVACGSAPTHAVLPPACRYVGADRSAAELEAARAGGAGTLIQADASALPIADGAVDTVLCSMALMILEPLDTTLAEIRRALRTGGILAATVPADDYASAHAAQVLGRILLGTGPLPRSPNNDALRRPGELLAAHGLRLIADEQRRFAYPMRTRADARLLLDSLYLPGLSPARYRMLQGAAGAASRLRPSIAIPIRRLIARAQ